MDAVVVLRTLCVLLHVLALAIGLGIVLREDWRLLNSRTFNIEGLSDSARLVGGALAVLWVTGLALIAIDTSFEFSQLMANPKLVAKITVVVLLTVNGVLLHRWALPILNGQRAARAEDVTPLALVGALSGSSWLYAAFLGVARPFAEVWHYADFMAYFGLMLVGSTLFALYYVRPRMSRLIQEHHRSVRSLPAPGQEVNVPSVDQEWIELQH